MLDEGRKEAALDLVFGLLDKALSDNRQLVARVPMRFKLSVGASTS